MYEMWNLEALQINLKLLVDNLNSERILDTDFIYWISHTHKLFMP